MRFISNGPDIPNQLLKQRDLGSVVFLCGAGVSIPSGLPSFEALTRNIIDSLSPSNDSQVYKAFSTWNEKNIPEKQYSRVPLDQVFHLLQKDYGRDLIGRLVAEQLSVNEEENLSSHTHDVISRISTNLDGQSQIVTTNFDLLFESVEKHKDSRIYVPPTFPDIQHGVAVSGITYLHGRLAPQETETHDYILSSADFGRAYLAQGWATSFVRRLLSQHTVVLVGYKAEDPPIKYLLQGLSITNDETKGQLFAFDEGTQEQVETKWRDLGVIPISYPISERHTSLWDTLDKWAVKSDDPIQWQRGVLNLSQQSPRELKSFQRGIVANFIREPLGAKQFSEAEPSPNIEWLCVFDPKCRWGLPYAGYMEGDPKFDLIDTYGLDNDPPFDPNPMKEFPTSVENFLKWNDGDENLSHHLQIVGISRSKLPNRLRFLCGWMLQHINSPVLAWWLARQSGIHSEFKSMLRHGINRRADNEAKSGLSLILDALDSKSLEPVNMSWYGICDQVKSEGWSRRNLEELYKAIAPYINISNIYSISSVCPPQGNWNSLEVYDVANLEIAFPSLHSQFPEVSDNDVLRVFCVWQHSFVKASELFIELGNPYSEIPTLYPEKTEGDRVLAGESEAHVLWFKTLFDRLVSLQPKKLKAHIETWPDSDRYIFSKFRFYAWNKRDLFSINEVCDSIKGLSPELFWSSRSARELLFLLKERWSEFSQEQIGQLCDEIFKGPDIRDDEESGEYQNRKNTEIVQLCLWLNKNSCAIPEEYLNQVLELKDTLKTWYDEWVDLADRSPSATSSVYGIATDEDISKLTHVPINEIINIAEQEPTRSLGERIDYRPFQGLVKEYPRKAVLALVTASRQRDVPLHFWESILSSWPDEASNRATFLLIGRMSQLPAKTLFDMRSTIGLWFESGFSRLFETNNDFAFRVFDEFVSKVLSIDEEPSEQSLVYPRNQQIEYSKRTYDYAMNSFVGRVVEGILKALDKLKPNDGIPIDFSNRFEHLISMKGDISEYTICMLARNSNWLYRIDPAWTVDKLVPFFAPDSNYCEPAWNAILHSDWTRNILIFSKIKIHFLTLPLKMNQWNWQRQELKLNMGIWAIQAVLLAQEDDPHLTFGEAKNFLRQLNQDQLCRCIRFLGQVGKKNDNNWEEKVLPFIQHGWPLEKSLMSEATTKAWVSLLDNTKEMFPEVFGCVRGFLLPLVNADLNLNSFYSSSEEDSITTQFPTETLILLDMILPNNCLKLPYGLSEVMSLLLETQPSIEGGKKYLRLQRLVASSNSSY